MSKFVQIAVAGVLMLLASLASAAGLFGQQQDGPLPVDQAYTLSFEQGENGRVSLFWEMPDDYYLYRDRMEITAGSNSELISKVPAQAKEKDDPLFGKVWVYYQNARVDLQLKSTTGAPSDDTLTVTYQGCWEGGICYPPVTESLELKALPAQLNAVSDAEPVQRNAAVPEQDMFTQVLRDADLWLVVGAFVVAGIGLAFTPCVFPMIPILSSIIAGQGGKVTSTRGFVLSLVYVLSVAVTYTCAGVLAGLFGANLQASLQAPWIIWLFSGLFVVLACAMFGFYQLQLPQGLQNRLNNMSRHQQGGTLLGVAFMGLLSALIVGPCMAAPLAGALIYIGQTGDPVLGGVALFALSIGMGIPLLLVGASAGKLLPKAGHWMETVKQGFGVVLLLMAVWMLDRILPTSVTMLMAAVVLVVSAVAFKVLEPVPQGASAGRGVLRGLGLLTLVYGLALFIGVLAGSQSFIKPLQGLSAAGGAQSGQQAKLNFETVTTEAALDEVLSRARIQGTPVMLDFYADWCISCKELEYVTFAPADVQAELQNFKLVKVDVTANDSAAKALSKRYSVIGPPALLFYDAQGQLQPDMLIGVIEPGVFLNHLQAVRMPDAG